MRVSTSHSFNAGIDVLQRRQRELADGQTQLTSGKRVQKASDDPTAAARSERALAAISRTEAEARAIEASRNVMTLAEGALGDAGELLQQAREFLVAAGNATYTEHERKGVAEQLRGLRTQLLAIANRSDGAGTYLFAGQGGGVAPFSDEPGGVVYRGVGGDFANAAREPMPLSVDGEAAWLGGDGGGVFATLDRAIRDLDPPAGHTPPPPSTARWTRCSSCGHASARCSTVPTSPTDASPTSGCTTRPSAAMPRTSTWCRRSPISRPGRPATTPR
jgi:flagellar hook-associated protein 3 FlgL